MGSAATARVTMAVLVVITVVAAVVGFKAATAPFPSAEDLPVCVETKVSEGQELFTSQVTVSVYNASSRTGLATRTMDDLVGRGFVAGDTGNVRDRKVRGVEIWAADAKNPAVALVRKQFRRAKVVEGVALGSGVVVVLGEGTVTLRPAKKAPTGHRSTGDYIVCSPPGAFDEGGR